MSSLDIAERVDGCDEGFGPFAGRKENLAAFGFFYYEAGFVEAVKVLDGGGLVDAACGRDFVDAEGWSANQHPDDFNSTMVGQSRHHSCLTAFFS